MDYTIMKQAEKGNWYQLKLKYIVKERSQLITSWGTYSLYEYENLLFITKRSYKCDNRDKVRIVTQVPKFMISEIISKKRMNDRYLLKIYEAIKQLENEECVNNF